MHLGDTSGIMLSLGKNLMVPDIVIPRPSSQSLSHTWHVFLDTPAAKDHHHNLEELKLQQA